MKALFYFALACCTAIALTSCGNNPDEYGHSTNIDSTNQNGTAPAQYSGEAPAIPDSSQYQDTRQIMENNNPNTNTTGEIAPAGNGTNTSNTTDKRTTTGSANNGDADGDRKK